jgi:hypothetical protein
MERGNHHPSNTQEHGGAAKDPAQGLLQGAASAWSRTSSGPSHRACLAIRLCIGCALIIPRIIQRILLYPSGVLWADEATNVSRLDLSGAE